MKTATVAAAALAVFPALASALTTGLIVPLYFYPSSPTDCWSTLRSLGTSHPKLPLTVIVNPDSGPNNGGSDYYGCLPALRKSLPNARLVGYVSTSYGDRASTDVLSDVSTYKSWSTGKGAARVKLDGIFFDELNPDASSANLALYTKYSKAARSAFGSKGTIVMNPGDPAPYQFYSLANIIVSYESDYSDFSIAAVKKATSSKKGKATPPAQQALMVLGVPNMAALTTLTKQVVPKYGWYFATDLADDGETDVYGQLPNNWASEVTLVVKGDKIK